MKYGKKNKKTKEQTNNSEKIENAKGIKRLQKYFNRIFTELQDDIASTKVKQNVIKSELPSLRMGFWILKIYENQKNQ